MRKEIYTEICSALSAVSDIQHVDIWNNQIEKAQEEQPFTPPAVFVEFRPIQWHQLLNNVEESTAEFVLHVVTDTRVGRWHDALERFDLCDKIMSAVRGMIPMKTAS